MILKYLLRRFCVQQQKFKFCHCYMQPGGTNSPLCKFQNATKISDFIRWYELVKQ